MCDYYILYTIFYKENGPKRERIERERARRLRERHSDDEHALGLAGGCVTSGGCGGETRAAYIAEPCAWQQRRRPWALPELSPPATKFPDTPSSTRSIGNSLLTHLIRGCLLAVDTL